MITTPEITISGKVLTVNTSVSDLPYFSNVLIGEVKIYTQDGFSKTPIKVIPVHAKTYDEVFTEASLGLSMKDNMFIFEFVEEGVLAPDTPCGMDVMTTYGAAFNPCEILNAIVSFSRELDSSCDIPKDLMDAMLQYEAIKYALKGGYIAQAVELYRKFFKSRKFNFVPKRCGCYGR